MREIERTFRFVDPQTLEDEDARMYREMSPGERLGFQRKIIEQWNGADLRRLTRSYRFVSVPRRWFHRGGAHALALHGYPRNTYDLDLWVRRSAQTAQRIRAALADFGVQIGDEGERQFTLHRNMFVLGVPPNQVDVLTFLDGCDFEEAWARRIPGDLANVTVDFLSL